MSREMNYKQVTIGLTLILYIYNYRNRKWYVDAVFAVHTDMRSHTGGFMTMITGEAYVQSMKKLNTKISTEAELVVLEDFLIQVIWT